MSPFHSLTHRTGQDASSVGRVLLSGHLWPDQHGWQVQRDHVRSDQEPRVQVERGTPDSPEEAEGELESVE